MLLPGVCESFPFDLLGLVMFKALPVRPPGQVRGGYGFDAAGASGRPLALTPGENTRLRVTLGWRE